MSALRQLSHGRRTKSSTHKYRRETCCVANSVHPHYSSSRYCFVFFTQRTDREMVIYNLRASRAVFLFFFKKKQKEGGGTEQKTSAWFKIHTCATDLVNFSPSETLLQLCAYVPPLFLSAAPPTLAPPPLPRPSASPST